MNLLRVIRASKASLRGVGILIKFCALYIRDDATV